MKCFICGNFSETLAITDKVMGKTFRKNLKNFCSKMYEDFVKAKQPDVCVNCQKVVEQSSNFKKTVLNSKKIVTKTWFENERNKIDLIDIFGSLNPNEKQLNHVYDIKDESCSQFEPTEDPQSSSQGSRDENAIALEDIFCVNDPGTVALLNYYEEQGQAQQKEIQERENIPKSPKKMPAARRQRSISLSKVKCKALNTQKRSMVCGLCKEILDDAQILRQHSKIHAT